MTRWEFEVIVECKDSSHFGYEPYWQETKMIEIEDTNALRAARRAEKQAVAETKHGFRAWTTDYIREVRDGVDL